MKIRKEDNVVVIAGKDKGKKGKILRTIPEKNKVVVEKLNLMKKHIRPRKQGEKGQRIEIPAPLPVSNVMLVCPKCTKSARIGFRLKGKNKERICKKCGSEI